MYWIEIYCKFIKKIWWLVANMPIQMHVRKKLEIYKLL